MFGSDFGKGTNSDITRIQEKHTNVDIVELVTNLLFVLFDSGLLREVKNHTTGFDVGVLGGESFDMSLNL